MVVGYMGCSDYLAAFLYRISEMNRESFYVDVSGDAQYRFKCTRKGTASFSLAVAPLEESVGGISHIYLYPVLWGKDSTT